MGRKIFVSYKYADNQVEDLFTGDNATVRDYVTELESIIDSSNHIYKSEGEDEDLSDLDEETIWQKLRDRIYDSTITIVLISPGMKEDGKSDRDQWIPLVSSPLKMKAGASRFLAPFPPISKQG